MMLPSELLISGILSIFAVFLVSCIRIICGVLLAGLVLCSSADDCLQN